MRLSKDDDSASESASITTQHKMLQRYAADNGYTVYDEYVDDGWSGTNFDRPEFKRMIADIEAKKINLVITKDCCGIMGLNQKDLENQGFPA